MKEKLFNNMEKKVNLCPDFFESLTELKPPQLKKLTKTLWDRNDWRGVQAVRKYYEKRYGTIITIKDLDITLEEHKLKIKKF